MPARSKPATSKSRPQAAKRRSQAGKPSPASSTSLVIVESPTKARTIARYLPKDFTVKASVGHVRDLPNSATEVPAKYKKQGWGRLGVNVEQDFEPLYVVPKDKRKLVKEIKDAVKGAGRIYFATDEDREGESISWHLLQLLRPAVPYQRLVFHEITKTAIQKALEAPRDINDHLVSAQETRRIVDRLFGYQISPLLWKKMAPRLSAGRVQSVAVRFMVERERERQKFTEARYWGMKARFSKDGTEFGGDLVEVGGRRIATGKDFDPDTGKLRQPQRKIRALPLLLDGDRAGEVLAHVQSSPARVASVVHKPFKSSPQAPYVTSTLQQDGNRQLRLPARQTMRLAQRLYESGFITYMRTDSTVLSDEARLAAADLVRDHFGEEYLAKGVRHYRNTVKNAQEAHEAIRPAGRHFRPVAEVRKRLGPSEARLYEMIWRRTLASQMKDAKGTNSTVLLDVAEARFRATGKTIQFAGYMRAYTVEQRLLPAMDEGDALAVLSAETSARRTRPPRRYTEASLIQKLEQKGIGRPSTWASIVDLVQHRSYAFKRDRTLVPTFTAMAVVGLLEKHFKRLTEYAFTARLENQLDAIARGELGRLEYLKGFYFGNGYRGLQALLEAGDKMIDPRDVCGLPIGDGDDGAPIEVRIGKWGPFLRWGDRRCGLPEELAPDELDTERARDLLEADARAKLPMGQDPATGRNVYLKQGRFGPYVQLGENDQEGGPKRSSLLKGMASEEVNLDLALKLLSLPRTLGPDPDSGTDVVAMNGRYGPFVRCAKEIRSIPAGTSVFEITLREAVHLLRQEKPKRGARQAAPPIKTLGPHPETQAEVRVLSGRYGPYVTDGKLNASIPKGSEPAAVTMEEAVSLLKRRAERVAANRKRPKRPKKKRSRRKARS